MLWHNTHAQSLLTLYFQFLDFIDFYFFSYRFSFADIFVLHVLPASSPHEHICYRILIFITFFSFVGDDIISLGFLAALMIFVLFYVFFRIYIGYYYY